MRKAPGRLSHTANLREELIGPMNTEADTTPRYALVYSRLQNNFDMTGDLSQRVQTDFHSASYADMYSFIEITTEKSKDSGGYFHILDKWSEEDRKVIVIHKTFGSLYIDCERIRMLLSIIKRTTLYGESIACRLRRRVSSYWYLDRSLGMREMSSWRIRPKEQRMVCERLTHPVSSRLHNEYNFGGRRGRVTTWQRINEVSAKMKGVSKVRQEGA